MQNREEKEIEAIHREMKKHFQKRYKLRKGHSLPQAKESPPARQQIHSDNHHDPEKIDISPKKKIANNQHLDELDNTLHQLNFNHHSQHSCLCNDCSCGRHLCKLNVIKPDLKKTSIYQRHFSEKQPHEMVVVKKADTSPLKGDHLDLSSIYLKDYKNGNADKLERPKPQDELKFEGPAPALTTYGAFFPGHFGDNQYVKPTNKHIIGDFPLFAKTVYSTQYVPRKTSKSDYEKQHDNLRTGANWFGASTYNKSFCLPNPESYPPKAVKMERYYKSPDFQHQFETNYKQEFVEKPSALCPSKLQLQASNSRVIQQSKHLFRENSDYKSMSPQFKAISTSKHFYV